jgi:hypothetical protein
VNLILQGLEGDAEFLGRGFVAVVLQGGLPHDFENCRVERRLTKVGTEPMSEDMTGVELPATTVGPADLDRVYDRDDLPADGEGDEVVTQGMLMALMNLIRSLKGRRESMGLTIGEVARRSRLTPMTISRLENLHNRNPSLDTLYRYAMAIDALVAMGFEEIEPDEE